MPFHDTNPRGWRLHGWKTLALGALIACGGPVATVHAQCPSGGGGLGGGGIAGGGASPFGGQLQAQFQARSQLMQQMAMQAQMQSLLAQQQAAAQRRAQLEQERGESARQRRGGSSQIAETAGGMGCASGSRRSSEEPVAMRETFAVQAARTTARDRQVARMREREAERQAALQQRIADQEAELELRRQRSLAQR